MANADRTEWSDEQLVVRVARKVFVIPAAELEDYRNQVFERLGKKEVDAFFERYSKQRVDAAYIRVIVAGDGDFIPERPSPRKQRSSKAPRKSVGPSASKAQRGRTRTSK